MHWKPFIRLHLGSVAYVNVCLFESVALPSAIGTSSDIRLGTLWSFLGSDVDLGFVLIGAGATFGYLDQHIGHSHGRSTANGGHRYDRGLGTADFGAVARRN